MSTCPCGAETAYEECCGLYHSGAAIAPTAEALMRSRYSAYAKCQIDYLRKTLPMTSWRGFDHKGTKQWAEQSEWLGLEIISAKGGPEDKRGKVEFIARFKQNGVDHMLHELSSFEKVENRWFYVSGKIIASE